MHFNKIISSALQPSVVGCWSSLDLDIAYFTFYVYCYAVFEEFGLLIVS